MSSETRAKITQMVAITERKTRDRRHSSDTSLNLTSQASISDENIRYEPVAEPPMDKKETSSEKKSKKWRVKGSLRRDDGSNASQKSNSKPKKKFLLLDKGKEEGGQSTDALSPKQVQLLLEICIQMCKKIWRLLQWKGRTKKARRQRNPLYGRVS